MNQLVSPGFLFRWSFAIPQIASLPKKSGGLLDLPENCRLPSICELDGKQDFAEIRMAWNSTGLAISAEVRGKKRKPDCSPGSFITSDGMTVWIDTRNTQGVHRATRFCHQFCVMPTGGARKTSPVVIQVPLARAREESTPTDVSQVQLKSEVRDDGYLLEAWFAASTLVGFDPANFNRLGFHYLVRDAELGEQSLAVGTEFPVASDPSLWQTLELAK